LVDEGGGRISYIVSRKSVGGDEMVKLKRLSAMSKKCMPKIVKRFDYTQDLLERR
jgi:hypothetical protein